MRKKCHRCLNDATVRNIHFDEQQICNFCRSYEVLAPKLADFVKLHENFMKRITKNQGKHRYDAAVGLSGGKDSTFVLYQLVKVYKLKVIAYTLDNGFLSSEAKQNIDDIIAKLGVDHEYVTGDQTLLKKTYHYITKRYLSPCLACSYLGYSVMINYASKVDAAVGIHGRSPWQMLRHYDLNGQDTFAGFVNAGLDDIDNVNLNTLYQQSLNKISCHIDKRLAKEVEHHLLIDAKNKGYRDFIAYFLYHPYDKNEIVDFLKQHLNWQGHNKKEHFDCLISDGAMYIKNIIARRPHIMPELSVMIRANKITKNDATKIMETEKVIYPKQQLKLLCQYAKINRTMLLLKARLYQKRWW